LRFGIKNNAPAHAGNDRFIRRDNVGYPARVRAPKVDFAPPPRCDIRPGRKPYADDVLAAHRLGRLACRQAAAQQCGIQTARPIGRHFSRKAWQFAAGFGNDMACGDPSVPMGKEASISLKAGLVIKIPTNIKRQICGRLYARRRDRRRRGPVGFRVCGRPRRGRSGPVTGLRGRRRRVWGRAFELKRPKRKIIRHT